MEQNKLQKKALFLPFMKIITGHHHVADALIHVLKNCNSDLTYAKVDILSYSYGRLEKVVSSTYLVWIKLLPDFYDRLYNRAAIRESPQKNRNYLYETLFTYFFKRLIKENNPRILFCTHALPSNIASVLKQKKQLDALIVNIYTDFFVNRIWGIKGIDYHFVPSITVKDYLVEKGVDEQRIFITGIPIDPIFLNGNISTAKQERISILITGGNLGIGAISELLPKTEEYTRVQYYVLCGKNDELYRELLHGNNPNITPFPYIKSKEQMNDLYNQVDGVLTKPGGVTVSECLMKRKPTFIYNPLPGQEKINADQLDKLGVVLPVDTHGGSVEQQIIDYFADNDQQKKYQKKLDEFHQHLEEKQLPEIMEELLNSSLLSSQIT